MIDEYEFFMNATLRICSHLEVEKGLHDCLEYLSEHMPADHLFLQRYEADYGAMRIVVHASSDKSEKVDILIPIPAEAKAGLDNAIELAQDDQLPAVLMFDGKQESALHNSLLGELGLPPSSTMVIPLVIKEKFAGYLAVLAEGLDRFDDGHATLFGTLKEPFFIALSNTLEHEQVLRLKERLADDNRYLHGELLSKSGTDIIGADFGLAGVMRQVGQVAQTDSVVLLTGETGVGKDVFANAIHLGSARRKGPFIAVNCGAIPRSLIDSELFGHEKGAFTGALSTKRGRFERADGGTILLDEIGDMPLEAQVRLLRVLQEREIERVGGARAIPVDIRIVAATNQDLTAMVKDGRFREDLLYRINVFPILVPALRERTEDIPALVQHFIESKAKELKISEAPRLAPGAIDVLMTYKWPGNVRELQNVIERAMIIHQGGVLSFDELSSSLPPPANQTSLDSGSGAIGLDAAVVFHIRRVLEKTNGKVSGPGGAAELLEMNPNTLRDRMKKLGIQFKKAN
jgi:transcriptional regulator with GAF, ATPase, and Fis domain